MKTFPWRETVMTGACVTILCGLGTWQVQRLEWKDALIGRLETAYAQGAKAPVLEEADLQTVAEEKDPMVYGRVEGRILRDKAVLLGPRTDDGRVGYHLLLPLRSGGHTLIVNAGWVSDLWQDDLEERLALLPAEPVTVRGILRKPDWSSFTSKNSPSNDMWFRADIGEIATTREIDNVYPFILYADSASPGLPDVKPHEAGWLPRNKHMQYAIFWYAMAAVMMGVYSFYVFGRNRPRAKA